MKFKEKVIAIIKAIPQGKVMSYGQVAAWAGSPRAARQVGFILRSSDLDSLPWQRVVNNQGQISIKGNAGASKDLQHSLLQAEGVEVGGDYTIVIEWYRLQTMPAALRRRLSL
jgi:methylated-DNA-protein-cysteine methyltransferase-like protein